MVGITRRIKGLFVKGRRTARRLLLGLGAAAGVAVVALPSLVMAPSASAGDAQWSVTFGGGGHRYESRRDRYDHHRYRDRGWHGARSSWVSSRRSWSDRNDCDSRRYTRRYVRPCPPQVVIVHRAHHPRYVVRPSGFHRPLVVERSRYVRPTCDDGYRSRHY